MGLSYTREGHVASILTSVEREILRQIAYHFVVVTHNNEPLYVTSTAIAPIVFVLCENKL